MDPAARACGGRIDSQPFCYPASVRWSVLFLLGGASSLGACSLLTDLGDLASRGGPDGAVADVAVPQSGFTFVVAPGHVTMDPSDPQVQIQLTVVRAPGFTDGVRFDIKGGAAGAVSTAPPDVQPNQTNSSFGVAVTQGTVPNGVDHDFVITGTSFDGKYTDLEHLGLWVGSALSPDDAGVLVVPAFANRVVIKAWGAGGGGAMAYQTPTSGGSGGFARAVFDVTPGSALRVVAGTGGSTPGGGGGYSAVTDVDGGVWLLAGGGGGGSTANSSETLYGNGGPGGGANGVPGKGGCGPGAAGTQTSGGAGGVCNQTSDVGEPGSYLHGGNGNGGWVAGGVPGGGEGANGGGGGGGYYGGGGGGYEYLTGSGGGGGGSGYVRDGGADAANLAGWKTTPPNTTDPDYASPVGTGGTGSMSGGPGRVVVRLPKP